MAFHGPYGLLTGSLLSSIPNEIYGVAGESSCGKTTLIKVISGNIKPPLKVNSGSVNYHFGSYDVDMLHDFPGRDAAERALEGNLVCHAGIDERAQPGAERSSKPSRILLIRTRASRIRRNSWNRSESISTGWDFRPKFSTPIRTSFLAECGSGWPLPWRPCSIPV